MSTSLIIMPLENFHFGFNLFLIELCARLSLGFYCNVVNLMGLIFTGKDKGDCGSYSARYGTKELCDAAQFVLSGKNNKIHSMASSVASMVIS